MHRLFLVFLLVLISNIIPAQENKQDINFKHISYKEGLVQSPIATFLQDDKGFIWFGNQKGVTRYDGNEFKTFTNDENNKRSISNNKVKVIFQDSDKNVWIGTANGVNLYNRDLETFTPIDVHEIKGGRNYISSIVEDQHKNIWIGTFAGVKKLNKKTRKLEDGIAKKESEVLNSGSIFSLYSDDENIIWAGTKSGLRRFNPQNSKELPLSAALKGDPEVSKSKVLVIKQDQDRTYWFGTEASGVFKYEKKNNNLVRFLASEKSNSLASNWVKDILIYDKNTLWFATRNGVSILDIRSNEFSNHSHNPLNLNSLNDNAIWSFLRDKAGCVWIGTFAGGINFYYKGNSNFLNIGESIGNRMALNHLLVNALTEDKDGSLWVGTYGGGLNHINRNGRSSNYYFLNLNEEDRLFNDIKSIADDGKGNLWVGTLDGLALFSKNTKTFKHFGFPVNDGKLSENLINVVLPDGEGAWVGTNGGGLRYVLPDGRSILHFRKGQSVFSNKPILGKGVLAGKLPVNSSVAQNSFYLNTEPEVSISDNFVTALRKDARGNLWVGTQDGLNYYDVKAQKFTKLFKKVRNIKYQIGKSYVSEIFMDSKQRLWIGTDGGGLNYFDQETNRFYAIGKDLGILDDVIHAIVEDQDQNLWVSTDLGLYKLKFKTFKVPFEKQDLEVTGYSANDGLVSNQFSRHAGSSLKTGEIIFGGINGLSIFYPQKIIKNDLAPDVALTQLLINNREVKIDSAGSPLSKSISETQEIKVTYNQASLSFKYAALNFINPENNQYAYKMEGLPNGEEWQNIGTQKVVNFANLLPGSYTFKVKAANNDGIWSSRFRSIKIIVLPPWWQTWWAYLLYLLVIVVVSTIIINFLRNRNRLKRDLYLKNEHNERQQELYQMKLNFFTNISHEIRTPLTLILGPLEKLLAGTRPDSVRSLELIKSNADRLMKLVTELLDFRKAEEGHMNIHCSKLDIVLFCNKIYESFKALADDRNIEYEFNGPVEPVWIYFDPDQIEKVVINLLSNAFKFTDNNGKISLDVDLREDNKAVEIRVSDNGKGIPEEIQDKLFQSFFQVDDRGRQSIGSGIGLALSKSIVDLHKGNIKVTSYTRPQPVTAFTISLKTGKDHFTEAEILSETMVIDSEMPVYIHPRSINESEQKPVSREDKTYHLLIAEDNEDVRKLIVDSLSDAYHIVDFSNGLEAIEYMKDEIPDLIISDIMMPGMDGLEFCSQIKLSEETNHIPFILLTAKASVANQVEGLSLGADSYLSKPFSPQVLALKVKNLLKAKELMRQKFSQQLKLPSGTMNLTSPEEKFIHKLMEIIESKLGDPDFDVNELVSQIGMSRTVLYKKVQALTNYSVADLIKQTRLKKAAELFKGSTLPVADVAYMVGFNDRKHFSKEFKKQYHLSPSEYIHSSTSKL